MSNYMLNLLKSYQGQEDPETCSNLIQAPPPPLQEGPNSLHFMVLELMLKDEKDRF